MADEAGRRDGEDNDGPPEVEAELVGAAAPSEEAFDADAPPDSAQAEPEPDPEEAKPRQKPVMTPGVVLFCAFAAVALGAFAVWRFTPHDALPAAPDNKAASAAEAADPDNAAAAPRAAPPAEPAPAETTGSKIANAQAGGLKPAPAAREAGPGYLPPVTADGAAKLANTVEAGAKEAMRRFAEEQGGAPAADIAPSTEDAIAPAPALADAAAAEAAAGGAEQAAAEADPESGARDAGAAQTDERLAQARADFAEEKRRLETALEEERSRNAGLSAEVENLRIALADAQAARDLAANNEAAALRAEIEALRNQQERNSSRQMRAAFALTALSRAIDHGDPYTEELAAVAEFEPAAASALEAHAATGVATDASLRIGFDAAARAALAAASLEKVGGGLPGLIARAQNLVSVRPAKPVAGDAPGAVLSRAEHALEQGDVAFALLQLEDLPLVAQEAMADWIASARARAEAQAALARLEAEISGDAG